MKKSPLSGPFSFRFTANNSMLFNKGWKSDDTIRQTIKRYFQDLIRESVGCKQKESQMLYLTFGLNLLDKSLEDEAVEW